MEQLNINRFTPQDKIIGVNNKFGNTGIKYQQGSTVVLYDMLPIDGRTEFRFFEGSSQRNFPFSNTGTDGNKLGVGNSMIIERAYLSKVSIENDLVTEIIPLQMSDALAISELSIELANSQILKQYSGLDFMPEYNKSSHVTRGSVLEFDTQLNIPPLLEFVASLRVQPNIVEETYYLRFTMEGTGAIIAPRTTF